MAATQAPGLDGLHLLVTGAAGGIGGAAARGAAVAGAKVSCLDLDADAVGRVADELVDGGAQAVGLAGDITDSSQITGAVAAAIDEHGPIDALIACAGGIQSRRGAFLELDDQCWDDVLHLNLTAQFHLGQVVGRHLVEQGRGAMVFVSSNAAHMALDGHAHYAAAKAGLEAMVRTMSLELAPRGVRVNCVAPGPTITEANRSFFADTRRAEALTSRIHVGRPAEPDEIVGALLYLASPAASFVTGTTLLVDGGLTAG